MSDQHLYLKFCTWNAQGIFNKYEKLLKSNDIDILLATETKLKTDVEFIIPEYTCYRADHPDEERKDGSAVFINDETDHEELSPIRENIAQVARIRLTISDYKFTIASFYSAPKNKLTKDNLESILEKWEITILLAATLMPNIKIGDVDKLIKGVKCSIR